MVPKRKICKKAHAQKKANENLNLFFTQQRFTQHTAKLSDFARLAALVAPIEQGKFWRTPHLERLRQRYLSPIYLTENNHSASLETGLLNKVLHEL